MPRNRTRNFCFPMAHHFCWDEFDSSFSSGCLRGKCQVKLTPGGLWFGSTSIHQYGTAPGHINILPTTEVLATRQADFFGWCSGWWSPTCTLAMLQAILGQCGSTIKACTQITWMSWMCLQAGLSGMSDMRMLAASPRLASRLVYGLPSL